MSLPVSLGPGPAAAPRPRHFGRVNWIGVWALYRRDLWRVLKQYRDNLLGVPITALLYLVVFGLAGGSAMAPGGVSFAQFLVPGLVMVGICQQAFRTGAGSLIYDKMEGIIADQLMAPLTTAERAFAYAASTTSSGLLAGTAILVLLGLLVPVPVSLPLAILFFAVAGSLLHGLLGLLAGVVSVKWDHFAAWFGFVVIPVSFLSGAFYPIVNLPAIGQAVVAWNPVFYAIDGFRYGFTGTGDAAPWRGVAILTAVDAALFVALYRLFASGYKLKA
jgi:ABC-2 type transport system permease protein